METSTLEQAIGNQEAVDKIYGQLEKLEKGQYNIQDVYGHVLEIIVLDILDVYKTKNNKDYQAIDLEKETAYEGELSDCCAAPMDDSDLCVKCGECGLCGGSRQVTCDEDDGEGHIQRGVGTRRCDNPVHEPDDFSGATPGDR